jgi:hypothetical protein
MWKNTAHPDRSQVPVWRMRIACWIPNATNARSFYAVPIAIPLQRRLHKRSSVLRYMSIAGVVKFFFKWLIHV